MLPPTRRGTGLALLTATEAADAFARCIVTDARWRRSDLITSSRDGRKQLDRCQGRNRACSSYAACGIGRVCKTSVSMTLAWPSSISLRGRLYRPRSFDCELIQSPRSGARRQRNFWFEWASCEAVTDFHRRGFIGYDAARANRSGAGRRVERLNGNHIVVYIERRYRRPSRDFWPRGR